MITLRADRHIIVVGAGGNIGSHLVPHLARNPDITQLTLVDPDDYEIHNLRNQAITRSAIGRSKVKVLAALARRINPSLTVHCIAERVEDVPLGRMRGDVILACLDSRRARQHVNEIASRLGVPWIDAGVLSEGLMARIDLYRPAIDAPCLECRWDEPDYQALEQHYPCGVEQEPTASDTPSALGAMAAAMQALQCEQLLAHESPAGTLAAGDQIVLAASHHRHLRTAHRRNPLCRFTDHAPWDIEKLDVDRPRTLASLFAAIERYMEPTEPFTISIAGKHFIRKLLCPSCGGAHAVLRLARSTAPVETPCARCARPMVLTGFGVTESLSASMLDPTTARRKLRAIGFRDREVVTATSPSQRKHFELRSNARITLAQTQARQEPVEIA